MRSPSRQLPLALEFPPAITAEDFWVASCNSLAVAWIDRWPDWSVPIVSLSGPAGSGKSHLARVWAARSQAVLVHPNLFSMDLDALVAPAARLLIDLQAIPSPEPQAELGWFHLLNLLRERRGQALIVSRDPVTRWPVRLPDLASRLATLMQLEIGLPDDALLSALLVKHLADRGARVVDPGVTAYLLSRVERRFSVIAALAQALNALALAERKPITLALARRVMRESYGC